MKLLADFLPIVIFFIIYKLYGVYAATLSAILVALLQLAFVGLVKRRLDKLLLINVSIIAVLGGATLWFHNDLFIKWKPTVINWVFALLFIGSQFIGDKPLIRQLMEPVILLPTSLWQRLNTSWAIFFIALGALNVYVLYHFSTNTWVNFKLFGILGLTLAFTIAQAIFLSGYTKKAEHEPC